MVACLRFVRDQTSQDSSTEWERVPYPAPLAEEPWMVDGIHISTSFRNDKEHFHSMLIIDEYLCLIVWGFFTKSSNFRGSL